MTMKDFLDLLSVRGSARASWSASTPAVDGENPEHVLAALKNSASKAVVGRTFGVKRSTLIDTLLRIGWSAGDNPHAYGSSM